MASAAPLFKRAPTREIRPAMCEESQSATVAARRLGVHVGTLYRLLAAGSLPIRAIKVGHVWRISKADLDRLLSVVEDQ